MFKKESSNISKSAVKLIAVEMKFVNDGLSIKFKRRKCLQAGLDLVIKMTVAKAAGIIALATTFIGTIAGLLLSVPLVGLTVAGKWIVSGWAFIAFISSIVGIANWVKETTIIGRRIRLL